MRVRDTETMRVLLCLSIEEWFGLSFSYLRNKTWLEIHVRTVTQLQLNTIFIKSTDELHIQR